MNPAFHRILPFAWRNPRAPLPTILWPHVAIGALAELMGAYVIIRLNLDPSRLSTLGNLKWLMVITFLLWVVALAVGIQVYSVWHV